MAHSACESFLLGLEILVEQHLEVGLVAQAAYGRERPRALSILGVEPVGESGKPLGPDPDREPLGRPGCATGRRIPLSVWRPTLARVSEAEQLRVVNCSWRFGFSPDREPGWALATLQLTAAWIPGDVVTIPVQ